MQTWQRIEERLKQIEKKIKEIRQDLGEMQPKKWDDEMDCGGYYFDE
jgi:hypothetical protein